MGVAETNAVLKGLSHLPCAKDAPSKPGPGPKESAVHDAFLVKATFAIHPRVALLAFPPLLSPVSTA